MMAKNINLGSRFDYIVDKFEDNTAIIYNDETITYIELSNKVNSLCSNLLLNGMYKNSRIGILCKNKLEWIISMLALVKIGATYIPLAINDPMEYIEKLVADVNIEMILTDYDIKLSFVRTKNILNLSSEIVFVDKFEEVTPNMLAYIMFTSGTTGMPKGVGVTHDNIINLTVGSDYLKLDSTIRILQTGSPTFDASTFEVWGTLLNGGSLIISNNNQVTDFDYIGRTIKKYKITTMWLTSPLFSIVAEKSPKIFDGVSELIVGGDVVNPTHVDNVLDNCCNITIYNGYGPTECTTFSTVYKITEKNNGQAIPIGKPINNAFVYILDEELRTVEQGEVGELYIGGRGVAFGYINNSKLTNERFIDNPFGNGKLYKTGDLVKEDENRNIYFLGRKDRQVKIRGYRIELNSVEAMLQGIEEVESVAVSAITNRVGGKEICCCVTMHNGKEITHEAIREKFSKVVPAHITLTHIVIVDALPINKNGKIDYKKVNDFFKVNNDTDKEVAVYGYDTDEEFILAEIIKKRTGFSINNMTTSFFELGVDSLMAVYLASDINEKLGVKINAVDILMNSTIKDLLVFLQDKPIENTEITVKEIKLENKLPILNQQRSLFIDFNVNPNSVRYNVPVLYKLPDEVCLERLTDALYKLVGKHDALRVKFSMEGTEIYQTIYNNIEFNVDRLNGTPKLNELIRPFNLKLELPFRFSIISDNKEKWLFMEFHHIVVDGSSLNLIISDLNKLYNEDTFLNTDFNYATLIEKSFLEFNNYSAKCIEFWREHLKNFKGMNELPIDNKRNNSISYKNNAYNFIINEERTTKLKNWCKKNNITIFEGLMTIYSNFLHTITGSSQVLFATPSREYSDLSKEPIIAMLTNTLWIYSNIENNKSISDYINDFVGDIRESQKYKNAPVDFIYELRKKNDIIKSKFTDTLIAYHSSKNTDSELFGMPIKVKPINPDEGMFLLNMQIFDNNLYLEVQWEYLDSIFEGNTIASLYDIFILTLDCLIQETTSNANNINELILNCI